jgi:uncharacterized protein YegL
MDRHKGLSVGAFALVLGAACAGPVFAAAAPDYTVIVLDASGSMGRAMRSENVRKIDSAKAALKEVLRQVPETTHVGLLVFSAKGLRAAEWVYPLGPRDEGTLMAAIDRPQPSGGTPLGANMKAAADRLLEEREKRFGAGTYRLLVVTDGEANDASLVDQYTPEIIARGIRVDVIGVDMKQDHTLATKVHSYRRANDTQALKQAISEVFAEVGSAGTDVADDEAFAALAPIPIDVASAMVQALSRLNNRPIGEKAQPAAAQSAPRIPAPAPGPSSPPSSTPEGRNVSSQLAWYIVILAIIVVLVRTRTRAARRRRR